MKRIIASVFACVMAMGAFAQKPDTTVTQRSVEVGLHAGFTTGVGFSLRYWPKTFGVQLTAIPIRSNNITYINAGLTGLYSVYNSNYVRFFSYLSSNVIVDNHPDEEYDYRTGTTIKKPYYRSTKYNSGIGLGFGFGSVVRIHIMGGYGFYDILGVGDMLPTGEIGLYYRY